VPLKQLPGHDCQRLLVRRLEHDRRCLASLGRLQPAGGTETPAVADHKPGKAPLRPRCDQVVARRHGELEKLRRHHSADGVHAHIVGPGAAAAVSEEAGQRFAGAANQLPAEHVPLRGTLGRRAVESNHKPAATGPPPQESDDPVTDIDMMAAGESATQLPQPRSPTDRSNLARGPMLSLQSTSTARWLAQVDAGLEEVLIDHAHCEKKAAGVAMNMLFSYVDHTDLARAMTEIVEEELEHFRMVLDLLERRGIPFRKLSPSSYGLRLHELVRKQEPGRAVDRLLVGGLIEARSCERFSLLGEHVADPELRDFYRGLFESEARHHATYVRLAGSFAPEETVRERLRELAAAEAAIIEKGDPQPRMHS
jgi:tRNA-(ms[2]io[6]A)-hydroxylase